MHHNETAVEVVLSDCQIVGNYGPGVSIRSFLDEAQIQDLDQEQYAQVVVARRAYVDMIAARITVEGGAVYGNCKEAGVLTTSIRGHDVVVWNKTRRGRRYISSVLWQDGGEDEDEDEDAGGE